MPREWGKKDLDNLISLYKSGQSIRELANLFGTGRGNIVTTLKASGIRLRDRAAAQVFAGPKASIALRQRGKEGAWANRIQRRAWEPAAPDGIIDRYMAMQSIASIARNEGVSRQAVTAFLLRRGVTLRTRTQANRIVADNKTPEQHAAGARAAHEAVRGKTQSLEHRHRIALAKERSAEVASPYEALLLEWLADLPTVPQKAVGPYNIDIAIDSVAVEVFGGHWHASGRHAARSPERSRYLLNEGWLLVVVWINGKHRLKPSVADQIRAYVDLASGNPTLRGQYRVIWGDGQDATATCPDVDHLARVPASKRQLDPGA